MTTIERYAKALTGQLVHAVRSSERRRTPFVPPAGLVTAADLEAWADRLVSQSELPNLVRRLIGATAGDITRLDVPSDEGVQHGGWDGIADVGVGNQFVPQGLSTWECGTGAHGRDKADKDFAARSRNPAGGDPAETTFVFVTPRRWRWRPDRATWEQQKRSQGLWRDVRVIDGDGLEAWLELAPSIHYGLSETLGKFPVSARPLSQWWRDWTSATVPALVPQLLLAGRAEAQKTLHDFLLGPPGALTVQADSSDEAVAFIAAAIECLSEPELGLTSARSLVILDEAGWRHAIGSEQALVLIPRFEGAVVGQEAAGRHHVVLVAGNDASVSPGTLSIPRLDRGQAELVLQKMLDTVPQNDRKRLAPMDPADLAIVARRSLQLLRRRLAVQGTLQEPPWAARSDAGRLASLALLGSWREDTEGDTKVVADLAGCTYETIASMAISWQRLPDPPIRRNGASWFITDREDAWTLLAERLTADDIRRFEEVAVKVLGTTLPEMELPPDQRWKAHLIARPPTHSHALREGLAETLAIMAARSTQVRISGGDRGETIAQRAVSRLMEAANSDISGRLWASLGRLLPLLAEAAPDAFLQAVEDGAGDDGPIRNLFVDGDDGNSFFSNSPHTELLWALETIAWSPMYLGLAAQMLARLQQLDRRGRLGNRPIGSLRAVFLAWCPQTAATVEERLDVIDSLIEQVPDIAWDLMVHLLPQERDIAHPTHAPRWQEWKAANDQPRTFAELGHMAQELIRRLLPLAGHDGQRWAALAQSLSSLPNDLADRIVQGLEQLNIRLIDDDQRVVVRNALRTVVSQHKRFATAVWAMPADRVERVSSLLDNFQMEDRVRSAAWLFTPWPSLPSLHKIGADSQERQSDVDNAREQELEAIYKESGLNGLLRLADIVEQPFEVGRVAGVRAVVRAEGELELLAELGSEHTPRQTLAIGFVTGRFDQAGWDWAEGVVDTAGSWDARTRALMLLGFPVGQRTWSIVERFGPVTEHAYWKRAWAWVPPDESARYVGEKLLAHGRAHHAVAVLSLRPQEDKDFDAELAAQALERAATTEPVGHLDGLFDHCVAQLFDRLEQLGFDSQRLAQLELNYLPLLQFGQRPPRILHRLLATQPNLFADAISWVFKQEDADAMEMTEEAQRLAKRGFMLLESWKGLPGQRHDGTVDRDELDAWVREARAACATNKRTTMGDQYIGRALAHAPQGSVTSWPPDAIAHVLERLRSRDIEQGFEIEVYNSRGVTTRGLTDGGIQERLLADKFAAWSQSAATRRPRTAAILRRISGSYATDADREDMEAQMRQDRGW